MFISLLLLILFEIEGDRVLLDSWVGAAVDWNPKHFFGLLLDVAWPIGGYAVKIKAIDVRFLIEVIITLVTKVELLFWLRFFHAT